MPDFVGLLTDGAIGWWLGLVDRFGTGYAPAMVSGGVSFLVLISGLNLMGAALGRLFESEFRSRVQKSLGSPARGATAGLATCWVLQSSSVTTSLMMPLVAHGIATVRNAYYFAVGAAVGTTIDSGQILAYLKYGAAGLTAGIVHITVNVVGALVFLTVPGLRDLPIHVAHRMGRMMGVSRWAPIRFAILIALVFYGIPIALIAAI